MTSEQELSLVKLYSVGVPYKHIAQQLGIPASTLASCIRRKHKALQSQVQQKHQLLTEKFTKSIAESMGVSETVAQAVFGSMLEKFQNKSRNTDKTFTIKFEDLVIPLNCPLLGIPLDYFSINHRADNYPTFDRIDNNKGYIPGNVHIVSWLANRLKNDSDADTLMLLATNLKKLVSPLSF